MRVFSISENKVPAIFTEAPLSANKSILEVNNLLKKQLENGITIYVRDDTSLKAFRKVINKYRDIFKDKRQIVDIPEDQYMEINLKSNAIPKPAKVYPAGKRNRKIINQTYNKLYVFRRFS